MKILRRKRAFTLVEIMIVVLIIGILLAIAVPNFIKARDTSRTNACVNNLREVADAKEQWAMDTKATDSATPTSKQLTGSGDASKGYIKSMPTCPVLSSQYNINNMMNNPTCPNVGQYPGMVLPGN